MTLTDAERMAYATAEAEERYRMPSTARTKLPVVRALVERHKDDQVLVIGGYIAQLHQLGEYLDAPIVQGSTTKKERDGLRQEEAQQLGRVLRSKGDGRQAHFYTVVSWDTIGTEYAAHRQRFLAEEGYAYTIIDAEDVLGPKLPSVD